MEYITAVIKMLLGTKGISLRLIVLVNGDEIVHSPWCSVLEISGTEPSTDFECPAKSTLLSVSEALILINYNASDAIPKSTDEILFFNDKSSFWERERKYIRCDLDGWPNVTIPFLRFRRTDTAAAQCRHFLAAANDNCPAPTRRVRQKIRAIYARWIRKFVYPEKWAGIRVFLQMFNSLASADDPLHWDSMDLRQLDTDTLSHVTFAALHACLTDRKQR
ncbi:uncharacterized protein LOC129601222 [Paramacrobiotus metropolitanus]|uniref:uncharacterized protein LOC129601222 n=1 Tax=Paramacrobiotus metropolitanus TaxID=2943436 RepID=UPI0024458B1F|nr:uncharacterized protein LOC129601222 [Paramacrobiotus metropolitanus]